MKFTSIRAAVIAATVAAGVTLPALAGIKYWDNPEYKAFDVGDYVSGAVWNYDGIRNVGATAAHDPDALTWKNLGSTGSANDLYLQKMAGTIAAATSNELASGTYGEWTADGFVFNGSSRMRRDSPGGIETGTNYTLQTLIDATAADQANSFGYVFNVAADRFAFRISKADGRLYWLTDEEAARSPQAFSFIEEENFGYATGILDGSARTTAFFSGIESPVSGDGFRRYDSVKGHTESGYAIGCTGSASQSFTGTVKFFRYYKRALSNEEVAWNRVVDEARYFNRASPLPVTNAVVASAHAGLAGDQPNGCYAVNEGGHTFTAPMTATADGRKYLCTGYALETWNGDAWGAPVIHKSRACAVSDDALVRITWQWKEADGIVTYDIGDYVWDGLVWFYDGICNVATNQPHSTTATTWKNLGTSGAANDVFVQRLNAAGTGWETAANLDPVGERDPGEWTECGFRLNGEGRFRCNSPGGIATGKSYTFQQLMDARAADQITASAYPFGLNNLFMAFQIDRASGNIYWKTQDNSSTLSVYPHLDAGSCGYVTAILNGAANTAQFFGGTTPPSSGTGFKQYSSVSGHTENGYCFGGQGGSSVDSLFVGFLKFFRYYDRALSQAELERNRRVDGWRYFGICAATNVVVASTYAYLHGDEPEGAYEIDGSHTFTAPASATAANGISYACDGYTVETWSDSDGAWGACVAHSGTSYAYTAADGLVRLTWKWKPVRGIRTAADYSFDDYSPAGLVWNYDGILNAGRDKPHSTTATTWKNLGSSGAANDLFVQRLNAAGTGWETAANLDPVGERDPGEWTGNGFQTTGAGRFRCNGGIVAGKSYTLQQLMDVKSADQITASAYPFGLNNAWMSFQIGKDSGNIYWKTQVNQNDLAANYPYMSALACDYVTAILNGTDNTAQFFGGTTPPSSGTGFKRYAAVSGLNESGYCLGGFSSYVDYKFVGTLKNFRYYDRVLTEEELVRNRNVDSARYFGELGVTNVFVVAGGEGAVQTESGAYKVEGEWTFTATTTVNESGATVPVVRYAIQTLSDGVWSGRKCHDGNSYTYTERTSPATVRLTWLGQPAGMTVIVR